MSVSWYIQAYSNGGEQFVPLDKILFTLSAYQSKTEEDCIVVSLPEGNVDLYVNFLDEISNLCISRPIKSITLYRIIFEIMKCGNFIFFAPDAQFPIILNDAVINHLPEGMLTALGKPKIANSFESFSSFLHEMYA